MNTSADIACSAVFENGFILVRMESGAEIRFLVTENPRLARGTHDQLNHIEISPFGLHWPELNEDLSFRGLLDGDHGQFQKKLINNMSAKHYPKGLDGRERDKSGQIREKRGDTKVGTLRKEYGDGFAKGYRSDTKLETVREATGKSLSELVKKK